MLTAPCHEGQDSPIRPVAALPPGPNAVILSESYAGLQAQAIGLAEAANLPWRLQVLEPRGVWRYLPARLWPDPQRAVGLAPVEDGPVISVGGTAAAVAASLRHARRPLVQVQHPRLDPARFDVVVVNRHDGLAGPNVVVTRTALHRATPARLAAAAADWAPRLAHLPRPLVCVLVGGSNGRFRLDHDVAEALGVQLAGMMRADHVGVALTPSRRTAADAQAALAKAIRPEGGWIWNMVGDNPYFGLLALADAIVVTEDSVSMVSEAVATAAPVLLATLPGRSRRIRLFTELLRRDGRIRTFQGRMESWPVQPIDDTPAAGAEVRHRLGV